MFDKEELVDIFESFGHQITVFNREGEFHILAQVNIDEEDLDYSNEGDVVVTIMNADSKFIDEDTTFKIQGNTYGVKYIGAVLDNNLTRDIGVFKKA